MFAYIFRRIVFSRLRGPQYKFSEKYPRLVIDDMLAMVVNHNIRMPIEQTVPLEEAEMKKALALVTTHRVRGRIAIAPQ
jgi:NADPH:quinone reductase-like Zn-dependent oxidoreductase